MWGGTAISLFFSSPHHALHFFSPSHLRVFSSPATFDTTSVFPHKFCWIPHGSPSGSSRTVGRGKKNPKLLPVLLGVSSLRTRWVSSLTPSQTTMSLLKKRWEFCVIEVLWRVNLFVRVNFVSNFWSVYGSLGESPRSFCCEAKVRK